MTLSAISDNFIPLEYYCLTPIAYPHFPSPTKINGAQK